MDIQTAVTSKKGTGFGALSPEERKAMAQRGNRASRDAGNLGFTPETAKIASAIARGKRKSTVPQA